MRTRSSSFLSNLTHKLISSHVAQSEVLFDAISRVIPDIRDRLTHEDAVVEIGTPLTHRRFNRRAYGTYGPGVDEDGSVWNLLQAKVRSGSNDQRSTMMYAS